MTSGALKAMEAYNVGLYKGVCVAQSSDVNLKSLVLPQSADYTTGLTKWELLDLT